MRPVRLLVAVLAVGLLAGACAKNETDNEAVVDLVDATTPNSYRFIYETETGGEQYRVQGLIEDDLRYKLQLSIGGRPALEQVVVDDAVAVRFLAPGLVDRFMDDRVADEVDLETDLDGADVLDALRARRWVIDPAGAPSVLLTAADAAGTDEDRAVADDPLFDSRTVLDYVRRIAQGQQPFVRYDPESLEPTYRSDEDPFLPPEGDSGVTRYDAAVLDLPNPDAAGGGTTAVFPGYQNFRRMAVYEKDGHIIAVREATRPTARQTKDFIHYADTLLEETAPPEVVADFRRTVEQLDPAKLPDFLIQGINSFRKSSGQAKVRFRTMALEIQDIGDAGISVELPTDEPVHGSLAVLRNMGRKPVVADESTDGLQSDDAPGFSGA